MAKRITALLFLISVVMSIGVINGTDIAYASEESLSVLENDSSIIASGECGESVTWKLDEEGALLISGDGEMEDYTWTNFVPTTPWYEYRSSIKKIVVEDGVTTIGKSAFYGLNYVTEVELSNDILVLGSYSFHGCSKLTNINLPDKLEYIANDVFSICSELTEMTIPESVSKIGSYAFYACKKLENVSLPASLENLPAALFRGCESMESIELPENIKTISSSCFYECKNLASILLPETMQTIGSNAFYGCAALLEVEIPNSVTSIGTYAFSGCTEMRSMTLPDSLETIPEYMCKGCSKLETMDIPVAVVCISQYAFYGCKNLKCVSMYPGVKQIGEKTFYNCTALQNIIFPDSLEKIGNYAYGYYTNVYDEANQLEDGIRIYCFEQTQAEEYAKSNSIDYSVISYNIDTSECEYTGEAVTPKILLKIDDFELTEGIEFCVTYKNNVEIGTATAQITFINDYAVISNSLLIQYNIGYLLDNCVISLDKTEYQYHTLLPEISVMYKGTDLICNDDVKIEYEIAGETWEKTSATISRYIWNIGTGTIKLTGIGDYIGEREIKFEIVPFNMENANLMTNWVNGSSSTYDMKDYTYTGTEQEQASFRVCDDNDTISKEYYQISYKNNVNAGTATMVVTGQGEYYTGTLEKDYTIYPADISNKKATLSYTSTSYTGVAKTPKVSISRLQQDVDYVVYYYNNTEIGTATIDIIGVGNYSGLIEKTFVIKRATASDLTISLSSLNYTYNGSTRTPSVKIKNADGITVGKTYYTVTYASGRKNVGKYKVTIKLKGNYSGTVTKYFKINPKGTSISSLTKASKAFTVKWKKQSAKMATTRITGYQIQYSTSKMFSSNVKSKMVSGYSNTSKKITGLSAKKTYYVRVRTYKTVNGTKYYSGWSAIKSVKTK